MNRDIDAGGAAAVGQSQDQQQQQQQFSMKSRHKRTPSAPLRVRTSTPAPSTASVKAAAPTHGGNVYENILSPSSAEPPLALPSGLSSDGAVIARSSTSNEKYGFLVYAGSMLAWWMYIVWAILPSRLLKTFGIQWYPAKSVAPSFFPQAHADILLRALSELGLF